MRKKRDDAEVNELAKDLVRRQSSKSSFSTMKSSGNSSESDSSASRFKTPRAKKPEGHVPRAPQKVKTKGIQDVTISDDESGDEAHRRTKILMKPVTGSKASEQGSS